MIFILETLRNNDNLLEEESFVMQNTYKRHSEDVQKTDLTLISGILPVKSCIGILERLCNNDSLLKEEILLMHCTCKRHSEDVQKTYLTLIPAILPEKSCH